MASRQVKLNSNPAPSSSFLTRAESIMQEVSAEPDIMGEFRAEVELFYKRDEVVVVEERDFTLSTFFSDLVFSRDMRVTCVRWEEEEEDHFILDTEVICVSQTESINRPDSVADHVVVSLISAQPVWPWPGI